MTSKPVDVDSVTDTASTIMQTPPASVSPMVDSQTERYNAPFIESSVPWPGSTFIIHHVSTGQVITFRDGKIILDHIGGPGNIRWECIHGEGGFLGFKDPGSGLFMGYNGDGFLRCRVWNHADWEWFNPRPKPEGGYLLLMFCDDKNTLHPVGTEGNRLKLAEDWESDAVVWKFIRV
ncbi:hypothetical protein GQ44DRAFT_721291 [Phaeosphaeriaceae sp. PMI808]|nr:hypothetical protein GQ44DRAFT_721291 [Phaeosphaeriaceae sp. PMI808]